MRSSSPCSQHRSSGSAAAAAAVFQWPLSRPPSAVTADPHNRAAIPRRHFSLFVPERQRRAAHTQSRRKPRSARNGSRAAMISLFALCSSSSATILGKRAVALTPNTSHLLPALSPPSLRGLPSSTFIQADT
ncbi:hypothetical protein GN956_G20922 [Arapaima gigas]